MGTPIQGLGQVQTGQMPLGQPIVGLYVDLYELIALHGRFSIPIRAPAVHSISSWDDTLAAPSWS